jgi:hypothetical protein
VVNQNNSFVGPPSLEVCCLVGEIFSSLLGWHVVQCISVLLSCCVTTGRDGAPPFACDKHEKLACCCELGPGSCVVL